MTFCGSKISPSSFPERLPGYLQKQQQQSSSPIVLERLVDDKTNTAMIDEVVDVLARSFAGRHGVRPGEATYDFVIGPEYPLSDPKCEPARIEFFRYLQKWAVVTCLEYGVVLIARERTDGKDAAATGRILGAVCALPPEHGYASDVTHAIPRPHFFRILSRMGWKPPPQNVEGGVRRMEVIGKVVNKSHAAANAFSASRNGAVPAWYVFVLGTDVDAQGKGCGTALLEAIHYLADSDGVDTMLEYSEERKRVFYCEKMGYENFGDEIILRDPKDNKVPAVVGMAAIRPKRQPKLPSM